jgi:hypothetical protein
MDGRGFVLSRTVHGVQDQGCRAGIDELMLGSCRHDDEIAGLDVLVFSCDGGFAGAGGEGKDLVDGMFLSTTTRQRNQNTIHPSI